MLWEKHSNRSFGHSGYIIKYTFTYSKFNDVQSYAFDIFSKFIAKLLCVRTTISAGNCWYRFQELIRKTHRKIYFGKFFIEKYTLLDQQPGILVNFYQVVSLFNPVMRNL